MLNLKQKIPFALLILICLLYFVRINTFEIQPWDEAMYAVRAEAAVQNNAFWDQTDYSCGGLYSSVHPPLSIWITAINIKLFGHSEFSIRLWSVIAGCGSLILIFFMTGGGWIGLTAAILMAMNYVEYYFVRLGQLDAPMQFFLLLSFFFWLNYLKKQKNINLWLTGAAFGLCLMSKAIFGVLVPVTLGIWLTYSVLKKNITSKQAIREFVIILLTGLIIALPWHIYMYLKHGWDFINFFLLYHVMQRFESGVEQNTRALGFFFYFNQFISIYSFIIFFMFLPFLKNRRLLIGQWRGKGANPSKEAQTHRGLRSVENVKNQDARLEISKGIIFIIMAFITILLLFSISKTKMFSYMFTMFPLLVILIAEGIREMLKKGKISFLWLSCSLILGVWSFSQDLRIAVKHLITFHPNSSMIFIFVSLLLLIAGWIYRKRSIWFGAPIVIVIMAYFIVKFIFSINFYIYKTGIEKYSNLFFKEKYSKLIYIDAERKSYTYDPQITYYFNMIDKTDKQKFQYIKPVKMAEINYPDLTSPKTMIIINDREFQPQQAVYDKFVRENAILIGTDSVYSYFKTK